MVKDEIYLKGLSDSEIIQSRDLNGNNSISTRDDHVFKHQLKQIVVEPMFILLIVACVVYFFVGDYIDGVIMVISLFIVAGISLYQGYRSENAIQALRKLSTPKSRVIRNGVTLQIPVQDLVVNDILLLE